jgi:RimJ/RimL family protein N-acetyltransferase
VFGVRGRDSLLVGLTHVAHLESSVELGLSVLESERGRGIAQALFQRALLHARNRGVGELYMHCLTENSAMLHISRKAAMRIVTDGPERDAYLALPQSTIASLGQELREGQMALFDWAIRKASRRAREGLLALA